MISTIKKEDNLEDNLRLYPRKREKAQAFENDDVRTTKHS